MDKDYRKIVQKRKSQHDQDEEAPWCSPSDQNSPALLAPAREAIAPIRNKNAGPSFLRAGRSCSKCLSLGSAWLPSLSLSDSCCLLCSLSRKGAISELILRRVRLSRSLLLDDRTLLLLAASANKSTRMKSVEQEGGSNNKQHQQPTSTKTRLVKNSAPTKPTTTTMTAAVARENDVDTAGTTAASREEMLSTVLPIVWTFLEHSDRLSLARANKSFKSLVNQYSEIVVQKITQTHGLDAADFMARLRERFWSQTRDAFRLGTG